MRLDRRTHREHGVPPVINIFFCSCHLRLEPGAGGCFVVAVDSAHPTIGEEGGYDSAAIYRVLQAEVAIL